MTDTTLVARALELVKEIEEMGSGLTSWEDKFVDDMSRKLVQDGFLPTAGQVAMLERIHGERC